MNKAGIVVVAAVLAASFAFLLFRPHPPVQAPAVARVEEQPRTDAPMEQYTKFFAKKQFDVDDAAQPHTMTYYWFEPEKPYPAGLKFPLVVILHGSPGKAYAAEYLLSREMLVNFPAFILVPQSPFGKKWAMPERFSGQEFPAPALQNYVWHPELESLPDVIKLIHQVEANFPVDASRIYILGCSDGGTGVFGAVLRYPDIFAGAAAISGAWSFLDAPRMTQVPLWILHGAQDPIMPVSIVREIYRQAKQGRGPVSYTEIPTMGHECPSPALYTKPLWQWLFSQKKVH